MGKDSKNNQIGIWIDHKKAYVMLVSGKEVKSVTCIESGVRGHIHATGGSTLVAAFRKGGGVSETHVERRHIEHLKKYYRNVLQKLGRPKEVFVFGPGRAKYEFGHEFEHKYKMGSVCLKTSDYLTQAQMVQCVQDYFGLPKKRLKSARSSLQSRN